MPVTRTLATTVDPEIKGSPLPTANELYVASTPFSHLFLNQSLGWKYWLTDPHSHADILAAQRAGKACGPHYTL